MVYVYNHQYPERVEAAMQGIYSTRRVCVCAHANIGHCITSRMRYMLATSMWPEGQSLINQLTKCIYI